VLTHTVGDSPAWSGGHVEHPDACIIFVDATTDTKVSEVVER
jgi:hypothetical protein